MLDKSSYSLVFFDVCIFGVDCRVFMSIFWISWVRQKDFKSWGGPPLHLPLPFRAKIACVPHSENQTWECATSRVRAVRNYWPESAKGLQPSSVDWTFLLARHWHEWNTDLPFGPRRRNRAEWCLCAGEVRRGLMRRDVVLAAVHWKLPSPPTETEQRLYEVSAHVQLKCKCLV